MTDFKKAFQTGLNAAKKAEATRNEIQSVFDDLNSQLEEITGGKINLKRIEKYADIDVRKILEDGIGQMPKKYQSIVAFNPTLEGHHHNEIANWSESRSGYPCKISYGLNSFVCENKSQLESVLMDLLKDPIIGEKFSQLIMLPKEGEEDQA